MMQHWFVGALALAFVTAPGQHLLIGQLVFSQSSLLGSGGSTDMYCVEWVKNVMPGCLMDVVYVA